MDKKLLYFTTYLKTQSSSADTVTDTTTATATVLSSKMPQMPKSNILFYENDNKNKNKETKNKKQKEKGRLIKKMLTKYC